MTDPRNSRVWRALLVQLGQLSLLIGFAFVVHFVPRSIRGLLLAAWIFVSVPLFIAGLSFDIVLAVAITIVSICLAGAYCTDMGQSSHEIPAVIIGLEAIVFIGAMLIAFFVHLFGSDRRNRTMKYKLPSNPRWNPPSGFIEPSRLRDSGEQDAEPDLPMTGF